MWMDSDLWNLPYLSFFGLPDVVYNIVVWALSSALTEGIESIHMRAWKIVYKLPMTTPTDEIKKLRQWNPISSCYVKRLWPTNPIMIQIQRNWLFQYLRQINYSLRNSLNIEVPRPRSEIGRSSFKHRAALAWNLLPHYVKDCANLRSFKMGLMRTNIY